MGSFGPIGKGTLVLSCLLGLGVLTAAAQAPAAVAKPVATVNGEAITLAEWHAALKRLPPTPANLTDAQRKAMHMELLGMLIDDRLMRQFIKKNVPAIPLELVNKRLAELDASLQARKQTRADFLRETQQSEAELREGIALEMQWQSYVNEQLAKVNLTKFYEDNKEMFDGVLIRVSHVVIPLAPNADEKATKAVMDQLAAARKEILAGVDFAEVVKKYCKESHAPNGGDLGYFPPRKADQDPFIRTASAMKVGEVSDIVRTDFGCHLIKVTDRKPGTPSSFEEVKAGVKAVYADEMKVNLIGTLRKSAKVEVNLP